jgi:hypothetical protein
VRSKRVGFATTLAISLSLLLTQTAFGAHAALYSGSGLLKGTWHMDFDTGTFNTTTLGAQDLWFDVEGTKNSKRFLQTDTGSTFAKMGLSRPSYSKCFSTLLHSGAYALSDVPLGTWFCLRANGGHLVRFRLDRKHPYPGGIDLTFRTWA